MSKKHKPNEALTFFVQIYYMQKWKNVSRNTESETDTNENK